MPNEIAIVNAPGVHPLIEKHRSALFIVDGQEARPVGPHSRLIPAEDLTGLVEALEATTRPATAKDLAKIIATIALSWPFAQQRAAPEMMEQHASLMSQDIAHFPADILFEVVTELRRTSRFMPAVAEIYGPASEKLYQRQRKLALAREHIREHARRHAEEAERAEQRRQDAERAQMHLDRVNAFHASSGAPYSAADFATAHNAMRAAGLVVAVEWWAAVDGGERWALELFPAALDAGRRIEAEGDDRTAKWDVSKALKMVFDNARVGAPA